MKMNKLYLKCYTAHNSVTSHARARRRLEKIIEMDLKKKFERK